MPRSPIPRAVEARYRAGMTLEEATVLTWVIAAACFLIGCLILWFIIYTAVRSALSAHRQAAADERQLPLHRG